MRSRSASLALLGAFTTACATGPSIKSFQPATSPGGAFLTIVLPAQTMQGELIAVEDSTILFLKPPGGVAAVELLRIPTRALRQTVGAYQVKGAWSPLEREKYRLVSRYPAGMTPELERKLLEAYGLDAVHWVGR